MKTPHTITLYLGDEPKERYNPATGVYETEGEEITKDYPCLFNFVSQAKVFESYGDRDNRLAIARFSQEVPPFYKAEHKGRVFRPYDSIDAPNKGAIKLSEVSDY